MPVEPVVYYTAICDGCGTDLCEAGAYSAWSRPDDAVESADAHWLDRGEIACDPCRGAYRDAISDVEYERMQDHEFWAEAAFAGWLRLRLAATTEQGADHAAG